jgi:predicted secreted protein
MTTKRSAFGTLFYLGTRQVETAVAVGTITGSGNATITVTAAGLAGSPLPVSVAVTAGDAPAIWAGKVRTQLASTAAITAMFEVGGSGPNIVLTKLLPAANDATLNVAIANGTCTGIVEDPTSDDTTAGVAFVAVAAVKNVTGPALKVDTLDVTSHDSTGGWEEVVPTVLRESDVRLDLVFDPQDDTHDATAMGGLGYCLKNHLLKHFKVTWPDGTAWTFPGYVAAFEPSAAHEGAITAAVSIRIAGAPVLA